MIGRWGKAAALIVVAAAAIVDVGLATGVLDQARADLPLAWARLSALTGPDTTLALAGRRALADAGLIAAAAAIAALPLGAAAAALTGATRAVLLGLLRIPALCALLIGLLASVLVLASSGPAAAALVGFAVATHSFGARATVGIALLPVAVLLVEPAARRLDRGGFETLATLGFGPLRRLFGLALPAVFPSVIKTAVICFVIAAVTLFVVAWPVPARQIQVASLAAGVALRPLAALSFCGAVILAALSVLVARTPA